jgi:hypothetical protein
MRHLNTGDRGKASSSNLNFDTTSGFLDNSMIIQEIWYAVVSCPAIMKVEISAILSRSEE